MPEKNLSGAFQNYPLLASFDISGLDTSRVTSMSYMFSGCSSLASLDLSGLDARRVTDMDSMFSGCSSLASLDLSGLDTSSAMHMDSMFSGCSSLACISVGKRTHVELPTQKINDHSNWYSKMDGKWYNTSEIYNSRFGIADTYIKTELPSIGYATVTLNSSTLVYRDVGNKPEITITYLGSILIENKDYSLAWPTDIVDVGEKEITIVGKGNYAGTTTVTYEIIPAPLDSITLSDSNHTFNGTKIISIPHVESDGKTLIVNEDYTVSFPQDMISAGKKEVTVIGRGNYTGTLKASYEIVAAPVTDVSLSVSRYIYNGDSKYPAITARSNDMLLIDGIDYDVTSYPTSASIVGEYTVTVIGKGNYTGTKTATFEILPAAITNVSLDKAQFSYNGTLNKPSLTVSCGDKTLSEGSDYTVNWPSDMTSVGMKEVTVTGKGNYTGTLKATYEIVAATEPDPAPADPKPIDPEPVEPTPIDPTPVEPTPVDPVPDNPQPPASDADSPEPVVTNPMFRLYNPNSGEHFYSSSTVERGHLVSLGWQDEGTGWIAPTSGNAVYRLYNPYAGEHHYTLSAAERDMLVSVGWNDEGIGWHSDSTQSVPLYRVYNPNEYANNHHYTTSAAERDMLLSIGWQDEGVSWYGVG